MTARSVQHCAPQSRDLQGKGVLVLLAGADARGKDLLVAAARRRYAADPRLEFPARVETRACAFDAEHIPVPRSVFRAIEKSSGFAVAWQRGRERHGLTQGALESLEAGRVVVIAVPTQAIDHFRALWPHVEIVPLGSAVDGARPCAPSLPTASFGRSAQRVQHSGDIAQAVRRFNVVLDEIVARQHEASPCADRRPQRPVAG